jgi:N-methylhydantoinase A
VDLATLPGLTAADLSERFVAAHRRIYFHGGEPGRRVEIVGLRCGIRRRLEALPELRERPTALARPPSVPVRTGAGEKSATMLNAAGLAAGATVTGPALIEGYSSSTWVPPGWMARRDAHCNVLMRRTAA